MLCSIYWFRDDPLAHLECQVLLDPDGIERFSRKVGSNQCTLLNIPEERGSQELLHKHPTEEAEQWRICRTAFWNRSRALQNTQLHVTFCDISKCYWLLGYDAAKCRRNFENLVMCSGGWDSLDDKETHYGLDGLGFEPWWRLELFFSPDLSLPVLGPTRLFLGGKAAAAWLFQPPLPNAEAKETIELYP